MICKVCGTENREEARFCRRCGTALVSGNVAISDFDDEKTVMIRDFEANVYEDDEEKTVVLKDAEREKLEKKTYEHNKTQLNEPTVVEYDKEMVSAPISESEQDKYKAVQDMKSQMKSKNTGSDKMTGSRFVLITSSIAALLYCLSSYLLYEQVCDILSADEDVLTLTSILIFISFIAVTGITGRNIIAAFVRDMKNNESPFVDINIWIYVLMLISALLSSASVKAAMLFLEFDTGRYEFGMIQDASDIYSSLTQAKSFIAVLAILSLISLFITIKGIDANKIKGAVVGEIYSPDSVKIANTSRVSSRGTPTNAKADDGASYIDQIRSLKALMDEGIITEDEFQAKKKSLLGL